MTTLTDDLGPNPTTDVRPTPKSVSPDEAVANRWGRWPDRLLGVTRVSMGWVFLWAFLDKLFGLGFVTESADAWVRGGSPTEGFLSFATKGPLASFYQDLAGAAWADWLFMVGLLGIGVALMLGIGMRVATIAGAAMLVMMWSAVLAPPNNPFMDDHLIYAMVMGLLTFGRAGDTWGLGRWWRARPIVERHPVLV